MNEITPKMLYFRIKHTADNDFFREAWGVDRKDIEAMTRSYQSDTQHYSFDESLDLLIKARYLIKIKPKETLGDLAEATFGYVPDMLYLPSFDVWDDRRVEALTPTRTDLH